MPLQEAQPGIRGVTCIYGLPTSGKTRLALSLPESYGKILYIPFDEGAVGPDGKPKSALAHYKDRITVMDPAPDPDTGIIGPLWELANTDWKAKGFDTMNLDTLSRLSYGILEFAASDKMGMVEEDKKQREHGQWGKVEDDNVFFQLNQKAHYGALDSIMHKFLTQLLATNREMNFIFLCHEQAADPKSPTGGPGFAGRAIAKWLPAICQDAVIHLTVENKSIYDSDGKIQKSTSRKAWIAPHGDWMARKAEGSTEPLPFESVDLDRDPVNFWNQLEEIS